MKLLIIYAASAFIGIVAFAQDSSLTDSSDNNGNDGKGEAQPEIVEIQQDEYRCYIYICEYVSLEQVYQQIFPKKRFLGMKTMEYRKARIPIIQKVKELF
uniref:Uncharacterized protein n=1 Tax=Panagrolaimus superbus TaxID=310955 RepID=A0A914YF70_9BILA